MSSSAAPEADSPNSFRAESAAATAHRPLRLRSPSRTASHPRSARASAAGALSSSLLHRSSSLAKSAALPRTRQPMDGAPPPPPQDEEPVTPELVAPLERQLYNTEVRSCGHPQRLYLKVPVNLSGLDGDSSGAARRGYQGRNAGERSQAHLYAEGTEAVTPERHLTVSLVHALTPPAVSISPYAAESARLSVGSEPLVAAVADEGCSPASSASAPPALVATVEMSCVEAPHRDEARSHHSRQPQQQQQRQGCDGGAIGQPSSPPATTPAAGIHAASSTNSSPHEHFLWTGTEVPNIGANVPADDVTESASVQAAANSGEGKKLPSNGSAHTSAVQLTEGNNVVHSVVETGSDPPQVARFQPRKSQDTASSPCSGAGASASLATIYLAQEGVSSVLMTSWTGHEAAAAAEGEALLPREPLSRTAREEASASSMRSVSNVQSSAERSGDDFLSVATVALPSALVEGSAEVVPVGPAPWKLTEYSEYSLQHAKSGPIGDAHPPSTQIAPATATTVAGHTAGGRLRVPTATSSTSREALAGDDSDGETHVGDEGSGCKGPNDVRTPQESRAAAWLLDAPGHSSAAAQEEQQALRCSLQSSGARASEAPPPWMGSGKELRQMPSAEASRSPGTALLPLELSATQQQQLAQGNCEGTVAVETHSAARDEVGDVVEGPEDRVETISAALIALPIEVVAGDRAVVSSPSTSSLHAEDVSSEHAITTAAFSHSPVKLLGSVAEQAPSALAAPESSAVRGGSAAEGSRGAAGVVAKVARTRQLIGGSEVSDTDDEDAVEGEGESGGALGSAASNVLAGATTDGEEVAREGMQAVQRAASIPRVGGERVPVEGEAALPSPSDRLRVAPPAHRTVPPAPPAAAIDGGNTGRTFWSELSLISKTEAQAEPRPRNHVISDATPHGGMRARGAPSSITTLSPLPSVTNTAGMWRWPPHSSYDNRSWHHHRESSDSEQKQRQSWLAATLFQHRPAARDLSVDAGAVKGKENIAEVQDTARPPSSLFQREDRDDGFAPKRVYSPAAACLLRSPAADNVDTLVLAHRRIVADAPLNELVQLEREGRRVLIHDMLQDREAIFQQEAADFSVLSLLPPRALAAAAASSTGRWKGTRTGSSSVASDGTAESLPAWVPPLPPSPLSAAAPVSMSKSTAASMRSTVTAPPPTTREEVERLLRTRGLPGSLSLSIVSTALLTDELLWREVVEDAEASARTILQRLCQCDADAVNPCSILVQEALARQGLMTTERLERQRVRSQESSSVAGVAELLEVGRELALCRIMEDDERRELIEKAEHLGRQRLRELHWRGLAARLRQRELLQATMGGALHSAIDDVLFDETQAREELRIEEIRDVTKLLGSASGTVVRDAASRHQRPLQHRGTTPQCLQKTADTSAASVAQVQPSAVNVKSGGTAAAEHEVTGALEDHAPVGEGVDSGSDWELVDEVVSNLDISNDAAFSDAAAPPTKSVAAQPHIPAATVDSSSETSVSSSLPVSAASSKRQVAITAAARWVARQGRAQAVDSAPELFEWDPTSNAASSHSTTNARKPHSSSSAKQHTSTSSPSPHLTNMTALTTTTGNTTSSEQAAVGDSGGCAPQVTQKVLAMNASGSATSDSRRSPTTVLQTEEEQQQFLQGHKVASMAEASALLHALRCAEASVRHKRHASRRTEMTAEAVSATPTRLQGQDKSAAVPAENLDGDVAQSHSTPSLRPPLEQPNRVEGMEHVVSAPHEPRAALRSRPPSTTRAPLLISRHTIPCSLSSSPCRSYAALVHKYALQRGSPSSAPLLATAAASAESPSTPSLSSPRPYTDGDVYVYDPKQTRHSRPACRAAFKTCVGCQVPWERPCEDVGGDEAASSVGAPRSVSDPTWHTPTHAIFPSRPRRAPSGAATMPRGSASSNDAPHARQLLVLEVITDRRSARSSPTADVTVSPMSSGARPSPSPTRAPPPQRYTAPTAAWAQYVQEQQLVRCVRDRGPGDASGSESVSYASPAASGRDRSVAIGAYLDQSGCSRRRWGHAEGHTLQSTNVPPAPLLITRLPLERGPGVWMSSPRDAQSCVHVIATTAPPRTRPAAATLVDAFSQAERTGEVVRLPTTVAELLQVPQHTRLPRPAPVSSASPTRPLSFEFAGERRALRRRPTPYNYADVFCTEREQPLGRSAEAQRPSTSAAVQSPSTLSAAFISTRCAAVCKREVECELRRSLQPQSPSRPCRAPLPSSNRAGRTGSSACAASPQQTSSSSPASTCITASAAARAEAEVLTEGAAVSEKSYFDDGTAFVPKSAAVASGARHHRTLPQRRQQRHRPRCFAAGAPAWPPTSPPAAPPRQQRRHSAGVAANEAHDGDSSRVSPAGRRARRRSLQLVQPTPSSYPARVSESVGSIHSRHASQWAAQW
ncbi:hypothetical protein LSCM1_08123 [Leishmania martiniquensis]|uniref:Uncharacterized protein n=1 Tax=Leishmania martiniquensis TaxID=1580590 RepID=A0A836HK81_9TRYP|nr:hypothetical protein LSCM1_08123 [Leishmania martiniquensis]